MMVFGSLSVRYFAVGAALFCTLFPLDVRASEVALLRAQVKTMKARHESLVVFFYVLEHAAKKAQPVVDRYRQLIERERAGQEIPLRDMMDAALAASKAERSVRRERREVRKELGEYIKLTRIVRGELERQRANLTESLQDEFQAEVDGATKRQAQFMKALDRIPGKIQLG